MNAKFRKGADNHQIQSLTPRPELSDSTPCAIRKVLYLDLDGVLQYADGGCWRPRLEAEDFLAWVVRHFECRWLTSWARPNEALPARLGIKVPPGIVEVKWQSARESHPFKAAAIRDDEDWVWLDDEPSEFDLADLRRRRQLARLVPGGRQQALRVNGPGPQFAGGTVGTAHHSG